MKKDLFSIDSNILKIDYLKHMFRNPFFAGQINPIHSEEYWEMLFVETNSVSAKTPNGTFHVSDSCAIFHKPGEPHFHYNDSDKDAIIIDVCFSSSSKYLLSLDNAIVSFSPKNIERLKKILNSCPLAENSPYPHVSAVKRQITKNHLELLIIDLIEQKSSVNYNNTQNKLCEDIIHILHNNIHNTLTISDIAKLCHRSESYIKKSFFAHFGVSIMSYFYDLKIAEAKYYLTTNMTVSQISNTLSFSSQNYFSTFFKKKTGMSPLQYKKSLSHTVIADFDPLT